MNTLRRSALAILVLTLLFAAAARAQALKQLPAGALVVFKINNPEGVSQKAGAMAQRLGLADFDEGFADPLGRLRKEFNIRDGFDAKGEVAIAIYDPAEEGDEPRFLALLPVTDYRAFLGNLANVQKEGDLDTFTMPDDDDPLYATNWGTYAAVTPFRELLAEKPAGIEVPGLAGKQLETNDIVVLANMKVIGAKVLPEFRGARQFMVQGLEQELQNAPELEKKYIPVIRALVNQVLNVVEGTLTDSQAFTLGVTLGDAGVNISSVGEFTAESYGGQLLQGMKKTDAPLMKGLPNRKYFAFGGAAIDPETLIRMISDFVAPVEKELAALGDEGKLLIQTIDALKEEIQVTESFSFGYAQPTGNLGQQAIFQPVIVYQADAQKLHASMKQYLQGSAELMKLMPGMPEGGIAMNIQPNAQTVDGVSLDRFSMEFKFDENTPEGAQAAQMMAMMYGPNGLSGYMGPVSDRSYVMVMSDNAELLNSTIAAAKAGQSALNNAPGVQGVAAQLPKERAFVYYVALDNILSTVLGFAQQMGMPFPPMKLPQDLPPIGVSGGTEGPAFRFDVHLSSELIESLVSAGIQAAVMMGGRGGPGQGL